MRRRRQRIKKPLVIPRFVLGIMTVLWWGLLVTLILTIDPARMKDVVFTGMYFPFLLLVFLTISGTLFFLRKRFWPSVLWAIGVSLFLILKIYGWGNVINFITIGLCLLVWEGYWYYLNTLKSAEENSDEEQPQVIIDS
jgi:hypothetical protein